MAEVLFNFVCLLVTNINQKPAEYKLKSDQKHEHSKDSPRLKNLAMFQF